MCALPAGCHDDSHPPGGCTVLAGFGRIERIVQVRGAYGIAFANDLSAEDAMAAADCALSVSGTATLHLVAHGVPAVVIYRVTPAGRLLSRALLVSPFIALPNLMAGERVLPEFLAGAADEEVIASEVLALLPGGAW